MNITTIQYRTNICSPNPHEERIKGHTLNGIETNWHGFISTSVDGTLLSHWNFDVQIGYYYRSSPLNPETGSQCIFKSGNIFGESIAIKTI